MNPFGLITGPMMFVLKWIAAPVLGLLIASWTLGPLGVFLALIGTAAHYAHDQLRGSERDRTIPGTDPVTGARYTDKLKVRVPKSPVYGQAAQIALWTRNAIAVLCVVIAIFRANSVTEQAQNVRPAQFGSSQPSTVVPAVPIVKPDLPTVIRVPLLGEGILSDTVVNIDDYRGWRHIDFDCAPAPECRNTVIIHIEDGTPIPLSTKKEVNIRGKIRFSGPRDQEGIVRATPP